MWPFQNKKEKITETFKKLFISLELRIDLLEESVEKMRRRLHLSTSKRNKAGDMDDSIDDKAPRDPFDDVRKIDAQLKTLGYKD